MVGSASKSIDLRSINRKRKMITSNEYILRHNIRNRKHHSIDRQTDGRVDKTSVDNGKKWLCGERQYMNAGDSIWLKVFGKI